MSGYGGSPPPGWQDPYGGQGWSGDPYGAGPYGQGGPHPGYGYGPPGVPTKRASNGSTTAALVCNIAGVLLCCGLLSVPGAITAAIAMSRVETDPESARKLTIWSWVLFGLSIVIGIVLFILYLIFVIASAESDYYDSTTGI